MDPEHHVIAVQCALEREAKLIISEMDDEQTEIILNNRVALGSYRGVSLVVCVGGGAWERPMRLRLRNSSLIDMLQP